MSISRIACWTAVALLAGGCGAPSPSSTAETASTPISLDTATGSGQDDETGRDRERRPEDVRHVLLLSVDGLHQVDLARFGRENPSSTLARLSRSGVTYSAARAPTPSDSFPGLLALVTGGTPRSTGVFYDDSYDRTLHPPGSACSGNPGTEVVYDESIDVDSTKLFSGGIDPATLPLAKSSHGCTPVFPHDFLRVNTVFEVVKAAGGRTAWADKHPAYDLVNGPSGAGVDDLYTPEINSNIAGAPVTNGVDLAATLAKCDGSNSLPVKKVTVFTDCIPAVEAYDDVKVQAVVNQIHGLKSDGSAAGRVPTVFGMNFQAVSVGQKLPFGGYKDASGTPSDQLAAALGHTDASIGRIVAALEQTHLLRSTLVIVTAKHGQSPIDRSKLAMEGGGNAPVQTVKDPQGFLSAVDPGAFLKTDDVGVVWLQNQDPANVAGVVASLQQNAGAIFADVLPPATIFQSSITSGPALAALFGDPTSADPLAAARAPNVFIQPNEGVIYSASSKKIAEHGGGAPGDVEVALLVARYGMDARTVSDPVTTTQVAPTILKALGLPPRALEAVRHERTKPLPRLHF